MTKCGIYARCSTFEQNTDMQLRDLRRLAKQRGFDIFKEYTDEAQSGGKTSLVANPVPRYYPRMQAGYFAC